MGRCLGWIAPRDPTDAVDPVPGTRGHGVPALRAARRAPGARAYRAMPRRVVPPDGVALGGGGAQWKKCRVPVKYIVTPAFFAASTTWSSRTEPPGWTTAFTPASVRISRPSGNGKNASEAA